MILFVYLLVLLISYSSTLNASVVDIVIYFVHALFCTNIFNNQIFVNLRNFFAIRSVEELFERSQIWKDSCCLYIGLVS